MKFGKDNMKTASKLVLFAGLVGLAATASAQVYTFNVDPNGTPPQSIPDGDANGAVYTGLVPINTPVSTNSFKVDLNIQGDPIGGNGDLYAILVSPDKTHSAVLLNRPGMPLNGGVGYQDNGMNVVIYDGQNDPNHKGADGTVYPFTDIHNYQDDPVYGGANVGNNGVSGIFKSDARGISPLSLPSVFSSSTRDSGYTLQVFQGINPLGTWDLLIADVSSGGSSKLVSWGLDFTPIPEPQEYAMAIGIGLMAFALYRRRMLKTA